MTTTIRVSELFGPTIQGEGPTAGHRAAFIRLVDCNLDCHWCDTPFTWDWTGHNGTPHVRKDNYEPFTVDRILNALAPMAVTRVVVTGGEPLLRIAQAETLITALHGDGYDVEVETNGTIKPSGLLLAKVARWNVSPKLSGARTTMPSIIPEALRTFAGLKDTVAFKFVITSPAEVDEVVLLCDEHHLGRDRVWLMPEGMTAIEQMSKTREVAELAIGHGFNFTSRLHTLAWGAERGR